MTVEVLGAVLGTAIQGQIVGRANTPCVPRPSDFVPNGTNLSAVAGHNDSVFVLTLDHTVNRCPPSFIFHRQNKYGVYRSAPNWALACLTCVFVIWFLLQKTAYMTASGVICLIYVLCAVVLFFGVREQKGKGTSGVCRGDLHAMVCSVFSSAFSPSPSRALLSRLQAHILPPEH